MTRAPLTGVLVLRVWLEDGDPTLLRGRVTSTLDVDAPGDERVAVVAGTEQACDVVRAWLDEFTAVTPE